MQRQTRAVPTLTTQHTPLDPNMAEEGVATKLAGTMEGGRGACKSNDILAIPMRNVVTHHDKQQSKREQDAPKKLQSAMKKDRKNYFGQGKRSPIPSTAENPLVQRHDKQGGTPTGKGGIRAGEEGDGDTNNTRWSTPIMKKGSKSIRSVSNENGQNKKQRSDDKESGEEESNQKKSEEEGEQAGFAVDLKSMSTSMKKKSPKTKSAR